MPLMFLCPLLPTPPAILARRGAACVLLAGALLSLADGLRAADEWPQFRGPDGQGHAEARDLPIEWRELKSLQSADKFTMKDVLKRAKSKRAKSSVPPQRLPVG